MSTLKLTSICKRFGPTLALQGVGLELGRGKVHALIGENGAGKTTLMNILVGILQPDQGQMELDGRLYAPSSPLEARRHGLALIHQDLSLFPHLSVTENILMGMETAHWGWLDRVAMPAQGPGSSRGFPSSRHTPGSPSGRIAHCGPSNC